MPDTNIGICRNEADGAPKVPAVFEGCGNGRRRWIFRLPASAEKEDGQDCH